jgi:hypothetical protein
MTCQFRNARQQRRQPASVLQAGSRSVLGMAAPEVTLVKAENEAASPLSACSSGRMPHLSLKALTTG